MAQESAERFGFDKVRQRGNLIERKAGRNRRTCSRMDVCSLQAQAERRERPCPCALGEGVRHRRPVEIALDVLSERRLEVTAKEAGSAPACCCCTATGRSPAPG